MKDSAIEVISIILIIIGIILGFFLVFDYTPVDAFFLEEEDDNAYLEGIILSKKENANYTLLKVYGCKSFDAYSDKSIDKSINESVLLRGSFTEDLFIVETSS